MRLIELSDRIGWTIYLDSPPYPKWFVHTSRSNFLACTQSRPAKIVTEWACGLSFPCLTGRLAECLRIRHLVQIRRSGRLPRAVRVMST